MIGAILNEIPRINLLYDVRRGKNKTDTRKLSFQIWNLTPTGASLEKNTTNDDTSFKFGTNSAPIKALG